MDVIWVFGCLVITQVVIDQLQFPQTLDINVGLFALGTCKFFLEVISVLLYLTLDSSHCQRLRTPAFVPIPLSMALSLARKPSCQASSPSDSWQPAPVLKHQSSQLRISSPVWQLKSFCVSCSSLEGRDQVVSVSFMISGSSFSCDCNAAE